MFQILFFIAVVILGLWTGCTKSPAQSPAPVPQSGISGLYWGRVGDVPEGMRVEVWLESDGVRVRGSYSAMPWNGSLEGRVTGRQEIAVTLLERGVTRAIGARTRQVVLHWDQTRSALSGVANDGVRVELLRAGFSPPQMRPGLWLSRWTGLPFGMAVETRIVRRPDGHFRGVYQYQGLGGVRDGSFDGTLDASGTLNISWMELSPGSEPASGKGRLTPSPFGMRGTYGIEGSTEGTGEWTLEPLGS